MRGVMSVLQLYRLYIGLSYPLFNFNLPVFFFYVTGSALVEACFNYRQNTSCNI